MYRWIARTQAHVCTRIELWMFCMGRLDFHRRLKIKLKMGSNEHVQDTVRCLYLNAAAQITVGKAQNRAHNECKYPCTVEQQKHRYIYVHVPLWNISMYIFLDVHMFMFMFLFAWDSSNSSGEGPNYLKINLDMNSKLGSSKALHVSPCTVTSVHCGIFLFFGACLCSYLHKQGFNGWHLNCLCLFHFFRK